MTRSNHYKYMDEESIGPALLCIICKKPFKDPQRTSCNHIFCRECLDARMDTNKRSCPACGKLLSANSLPLISRTLINMLHPLRVECTLCGQTNLRQGHFDDHINKECPKFRVFCPSETFKSQPIGQRSQLNDRLCTCIPSSFPSVVNKLYNENRQLKELCQQQQCEIQKLQTVNQQQTVKIERIEQRGKCHEDQINELTARIADIERARTIPSIPTPDIAVPSPVVTVTGTTDEKTILDVTPAWFQPVKPVHPDNIRYPANYDRNSPADVRMYDCLSAYRSMIMNTKIIDFVLEPFSSAVDDTETLIVILNELTHQFGARLAFTHVDVKYDDSDYRTACGVTNLGSIHSFFASEENCQTAKFNLHFKLDYDQITASSETLRKFVLTSINDISFIAQCNKEFVRVFDIARTSSVLVGFGITTPHIHQTKQVADLLKTKLNKTSITQRSDVFQYLFPEHYEYKLEPALAFLQLQQTDFEPHYNRDYPDRLEAKRGGRPYYFPRGWYRHALKVVDKYPGDQVWLGMNNSLGEWAVAYHGTDPKTVRGIVDNGLLQNLVTTDAMKNEAKKQNPSIPDVNGLYVATHCEGGASEYASSFTVRDSTDKNKTYRVVFQCRVQPEKFTEHDGPVKVGMAWRVFDEKAIRPYGILLEDS